MEGETHIIRRQKFSVLHHGNTNVFALQQASEQFCKDRLLPAIEEMFDKQSNGKTIYIPKLNLQFSVDSVNGLNELLVLEIVDKLAKEVSESKKLSDDVKTANIDIDIIQGFLFYLKSGVLTAIGSYQHRIIWIEKVFEGLRNVNASSKNALYKILQSPKGRENLAAINSDELFWATLTVVVSDQNLLIRIKKLFGEWMQLTTKYAISFPAFFAKVFFAKNIINANDEMSIKAIIKLEEILTSIKTKTATSSIKEIHELHERILRMSLEEKDENSKKIAHEEKKENQQLFDTSILVPNAGLVIVHPFLPAFFAKIGIQTKQGIEEKERAVMILHYMATGSTTAEPFELVLPKILLNVPLSETIVPAHIVSEIEKLEVDNLLKALISHWKILKNTSPKGLRESFLQRMGKAKLTDEKWTIQIEKGPFDILIEQLPWSISMIKLPWMKDILMVEWE